MDLEIKYADKEQALKDELEKCKLEAENEQKKLLKDRQTREKIIMFDQMMQNCSKDDLVMKEYL